MNIVTYWQIFGEVIPQKISRMAEGKLCREYERCHLLQKFGAVVLSTITHSNGGEKYNRVYTEKYLQYVRIRALKFKLRVNYSHFYIENYGGYNYAW